MQAVALTRGSIRDRREWALLSNAARDMRPGFRTQTPSGETRRTPIEWVPRSWTRVTGARIWITYARPDIPTDGCPPRLSPKTGGLR